MRRSTTGYYWGAPTPANVRLRSAGCRGRPASEGDVIGWARHVAGGANRCRDLPSVIGAVQTDMGQNVFQGRRELIAGTVAVSDRRLTTFLSQLRNHALECGYVLLCQPLGLIESQRRPDSHLSGCALYSRQPDVLCSENV